MRSYMHGAYWKLMYVLSKCKLAFHCGPKRNASQLHAMTSCSYPHQEVPLRQPIHTEKNKEKNQHTAMQFHASNSWPKSRRHWPLEDTTGSDLRFDLGYRFKTGERSPFTPLYLRTTASTARYSVNAII